MGNTSDDVSASMHPYQVCTEHHLISIMLMGLYCWAGGKKFKIVDMTEKEAAAIYAEGVTRWGPEFRDLPIKFNRMSGEPLEDPLPRIES